jgi:hypothetical protein
MIAIDFLYHNMYASPLDSITYDMTPVIPLKYPKSEKMNFLTPHFLRTEGHIRSYDSDSDSPSRVKCTHMYGS